MDQKEVPQVFNILTDRVKSLERALIIVDKLQARITDESISTMNAKDAIETMKVLSKSFVDVMELIRKFSLNEAFDKLANLELYYVIKALTPEKREKLKELITTLEGDI